MKAIDIVNKFKVTDKFAEILLGYGFNTLEEVQEYLHPTFNYFAEAGEYSGFAAAKERIESAIKDGESVVVYGDYDCDGICSVAMLYSYLAERGCEVRFFIPDRHTDGYGISIEAMEHIAESCFPDLIISVDCGITAREEAEYVHETLGIDLIITDHHECGDMLPECIVVDPKIDRDKGIFCEYSGAGVVYRLIEYISGREIADKYLDIAAISTIGDIVPLVRDNRTIASLGMRALKKSRRKGLKMLLESIDRYGKELTSYDISFKIVPRINAMGRLGDANVVVDLFLSDDHFELSTLIEQLNETNELRQKLTENVTAECFDMLEDRYLSAMNSIVLVNDKWESGIIGIVCSRLVGEFNRPVILFTADAADNAMLKGSGRSCDGVNLFETLKECSAVIEAFGGHKKACGLSIKKENFDKFYELFDAAVRASRVNTDNITTVEVSKEDITLEFARELELLEPYGEGNPRTVFMAEIGKSAFKRIKDSDHIKYRPNVFTEYIAFNSLSKKDLLNSDCVKKLRVAIKYVVYNNDENVQISVKDVGLPNHDEIPYERAYCDYCKTLLRGQETCFSVTEICAEDISKIEGSVCCIAYSPHAVNYALEMSDRELEICYGDIPSVDPIDRILIAPLESVNLKYYDNIVFIDRPVGYGFIDYMRLNKRVRVFTISEKSDIISAVKAVIPTYNELKRIFRAMKSELERRVFTDMYDLYDAIACDGLSKLSYSIAFYTLFDLKIIKFTKAKAIFIDSTVQTKLENSEFYNALRNITE